MSKRTRIFIGILLIYAAGIAVLLYRVVTDIDPRYRESAEESLVETSQLLATLIEQDSRDGAIGTARLPALFQSLYEKRFKAQIYSVTKQKVELRAYVTDAAGRVVYDSTGRWVGADFSQWRDVSLTLRGGYGARATPEDEKDPNSSVMYVGAPIHHGGRIIGVATVAKPEQSFGQFATAARRKTVLVGVVSVLSVLLLAVMVSAWLVRPFGVLADYARFVRTQRPLSPRRLWRRALDSARAAWDEMRDALAGRNYVADYVQTLTHEVKSPLSAIRGAAELLQEPGMPQAERQRFLANITRETARIQELVDRMMELTALESRRALDSIAPVALAPLLDEVVGAAQASASARGVRVLAEAAHDATVEGDAFLLRRALGNLLDNAIDFAPAGSSVRVGLARQGRSAHLTVRDSGPGIPPYAQEKVFEKFYSLARPHNQKKSTGLGLSFVQEIATLHRGRVALANAPEGGALAELWLPLASG